MSGDHSPAFRLLFAAGWAVFALTAFAAAQTADLEPQPTEEGFRAPLNPEVELPSSVAPASESLKYGDVYTLSNQKLIFPVPTDLKPQERLFITLSGNGEVDVAITSKSGGGDSFRQQTVTVTDSRLRTVAAIDHLFLRSPTATLILSRQASYGDIKVIFSKGENLEMTFGQSLKVWTEWTSELPVAVTVGSGVDANAPNRLQFILDSSLDQQTLKGDEALEMYINKSPLFPTKNSFETRASGYLGSGLIKTINKSSSLYCTASDCVYRVLLVTKGVHSLNFLPTVMANGSPIRFEHTLNLLEEVEVSEQVEYVLEVPTTDDTWVFTILPYEGNVQVFINPDGKEPRLLDYKYRATSHRAEEIVITRKEGDAFGFKAERFFVAFKSSDQTAPATFRFSARRLPASAPVPINQNYAETGVVAHNEIVNFDIDLSTADTEVVSVEMRLESFHGSANLYVKECLDKEVSCVVAPQDTQGVVQTDRIFRVSKADRGSTVNKVDFVLLQFMCLKGRGGADDTPTKYPRSLSCRFTVGVECGESTNNYGTYYKLTAYGKGHVSDLTLSSANLVTMYPKSKERFQAFLGPSSITWNGRSIYYKFTVMTGKFRAYFSASNPRPDQGDHDAAVEVENDNYSSVHTKKVTGSLPLSSSTFTDASDGKFLFMAVEAEEYCNFEIELRMSQEELSDNTLQYIMDKRIVHREIAEGTRVLGVPGNPKQIYFARRFVYVIPPGEPTRYDSKIKVHLSSSRLGLELCAKVVAAGQTQPASEACDFHSNNDLLLIPKSDPKMRQAQSVVIEVQKPFDVGFEAPKLPIEFSLKVDDADNYENIELVHPGHSVSATLNPGMSQDYLMDVGHATRNVAVYFRSMDPQMTAFVFASSVDSRISVGLLTDKRPGLKIHDPVGFRKQFCPNVECKLFISVYTEAPTMHRYNLLFTVDDSPIRMREGETFRIADNQISWFLFEPDDRSPISFSVHDQKTQTQIYARLMDLTEQVPVRRADVDALLATSFDFKSDVDKDPQVVIPLSVLRANPRKKLAVAVRPVLDVTPPDTSRPFELLPLRKTMDIYVHSRLLRLEGFYQTRGVVGAGEFAYFYFNVDEVGDFSVILSVTSGSPLLFLGKDAGSLPTQHRFWKRGSGAKSDEVIVTKEELLELKPAPRQFYVGVYGREASAFKVLYMPDFRNLVHVKFQTLEEFELDPEKKFYLAYTNVKEVYDTLLYSEGGDIEVSALNYDDSQSNFVAMVTEEANFAEKFTFRKGDLPRKKHFERVAQLDSQTIVRVRAQDSHCRVFFAIYDAKQPIEIAAEKQISFTQDKGDVHVFKARLGATYDEFEVNFRLEFGAVAVRFASDVAGLRDAPVQQMSVPGQKVWQYRAEGLPRANDILIFKEVYVEVASSEFSRFDVMVKPKERFLELRAFEPEIVSASADSDVFVFFTLTPKALKWVRSLRIDFQCHESFRERPELLFIADAEVTLSPDSPFIPMPMDDLFEKTVAEFYHLDIKPAPQAGSYVLKIGRTATPHPIRVAVSLNDQRNINPNGVYHGAVPAPGKSHEYSVYLPADGEYRIAIESCRKVQIDSAQFHGQNSYIIDKRDFNLYGYDAASGITTVNFNKNFRQAQTYLSLVQVPFKTHRGLSTVLLNIKRGFVTSPGLLRFNVTGSGGPEAPADPSLVNWHGNKEPSGVGSDVEYTGPSGNTYLIMTEFRPFSKELVLKDYIKLPTKTDLDHHSPVAKFVDGNLLVISRIPSFTPQLLVDYPHLRFVVVKLHAYLFFDPAFETKYQDCGLACFTEIPHSYSVASVNITRENLADPHYTWTEPLMFNASQIAPFRSSESLHVFCLASVHFYNNEDELHQVSRNSKYTSVPLYFAQFVNESRSFFTAHWGALLVICLTAVFLVCVYRKVRRTGEEGEGTFAYGQVSRGVPQADKGGYTRPSQRVEMSAVSSTDSFNN